MAVGKEAPIPSIAVVARAHRQSLDATVDAFTEAFAALPAAVIKRKLKGANITIPHFVDNDEEKSSAAAASSDEILL